VNLGFSLWLFVVVVVVLRGLVSLRIFVITWLERLFVS
jgi:hypothetical protein